MKTKPMSQQKIARRKLRKNPEFYALACEQGTGKTWMLLDDAEYQWKKKMITGLLVIAPKGVHTNWTNREIPKHMSITYRCGHYNSGMGKRALANLEKLFKPNTAALCIFAINIDALNTKKGFDLCTKFLIKHNAMAILDESSRIKNPTSGRSKKAHRLAEMAVSRRTASGTMITQGPLDVFSQFEFLLPGGNLLGTTSYRSFVSEYAKLIPTHNKDGSPNPLMASIKRNNPYGNPQIVQRDAMGRPKYRNLKKLGKLMKPYVYRVTKKECLDLPDKVYQLYTHELDSKNRRIYNEIEEELRYLKENGDLDIFTALTKIMKVRQVVSGFIISDEKVVGLQPAAKNPRMQLLKEILTDLDKPFIIWAMFKEEIKQIIEMLHIMGIESVAYHGSVKTKAREAAVDDFQDGTVTGFVGQPAAGGLGLTLTAAYYMIYYSGDYNLETRLQSEDRPHRIGLDHKLTIIDIAAENTIDERMAVALQNKEDVGNTIFSYI